MVWLVMVGGDKLQLHSSHFKNVILNLKEKVLPQELHLFFTKIPSGKFVEVSINNITG